MSKKILSLLAVLTIVSCGQEQDYSARDTLRVGVPAEAVTLFPYGSNDTPSARIHGNIYDRLLEKDENGNFEPSLATAWEFISPTHLRRT